MFEASSKAWIGDGLSRFPLDWVLEGIIGCMQRKAQAHTVSSRSHRLL